MASLRRASAILSNITSIRHSSIARQAMHASPRGAGQHMFLSATVTAATVTAAIVTAAIVIFWI
jgi:hypothetical protein